MGFLCVKSSFLSHLCNMVYVDIWFAGPMETAFTYTAPSGAQVGQWAQAPLKGRLCLGVVWIVHPADYTPTTECTAAIEQLLPLRPLPQLTRRFYDWISAYYMCSLGKVLEKTYPSCALEARSPRHRAGKKALASPWTLKDITTVTALEKAWTQTKFIPATTCWEMPWTPASNALRLLAQQCVWKKKYLLWILPTPATANMRYQQLQAHIDPDNLLYEPSSLRQRKTQAWQRISTEQPLIILGLAHQLFLPLHSLDYLIIEETQDPHHAHNHEALAYHGVHAALMLGRLAQAKTLLRSAVPTLGSWYRIQKKQYTHLSPPIQPTAQITYMQTQYGQAISRQMRQKIQSALKKNEQIIYFLPYDGYAQYVLCQHCHQLPRCAVCGSVWRLFHGHLLCLQCRASADLSAVSCTQCQRSDWQSSGVAGLEQVEEALSLHFRDSPQTRLPVAIKTNKRAAKQAQEAFVHNKIHLLTSTLQPLYGWETGWKGLVIVGQADRYLAHTHYQAQVTCYQQLRTLHAQLRPPTRLIIEGSAVKSILSQDTQTFYKQESQLRHTFGYPPYQRTLEVRIQHREATAATAFAAALVEQAKQWDCEGFYSAAQRTFAPPRHGFVSKVFLKFPLHSPAAKAYIRQYAHEYQQAHSGLHLRYIVDA